LSEDTIYRELQQHLDKMPVGFPPTKSGVEIRILKQLFTPEEAKIATNIDFSITPTESLEKIYDRVKDTGISKENLEKILNQMVKKGHLYFKEENGKKYYSHALFAVGIYEHQVNRLSKSFLKDFFSYSIEKFGLEVFKTKVPQLRVIPIEYVITPENLVGHYDDLKEIIENSEGPFAVQNCICRQAMDLMGRPCKVTSRKETCIGIGQFAQHYIEQGWGREVNKEELLEILRKNEEEGLVLQPANTLRPGYICSCCGCCCGILTGAKILPKPAEHFASNYYAVVNPELCSGCGLCVDRCQMDAITIYENISTINKDKCIGCGLCVSTCSSEAITLEKKEIKYTPPADYDELYAKILKKKINIQKKEEVKRELRRRKREARRKQREIKN